MGASQTKVSCLWLPAQSGKTRRMTEQIELYRDVRMLVGKRHGVVVSSWDEQKFADVEDEIDQEEEDDNFFNIIICSNNSMLVQQTQARMEADLFTPSFTVHDEEKKEIIMGDTDDDDESQVYSWLSVTNDGLQSRDIANRIILGQLKMLICCSHYKRFEAYLYPLLRMLNKDFSKRVFHKKVNIWIDEADSSINLWSKYEPILDMTVVNKVTLVSATFNSVIKKYKKISVIPFEKTHPDSYVRLQDANFLICNEKKDSAISYIRAVVKENDLIEKLVGGYCLFAPGDVYVDSHESIKTYFLIHGCAVAVLNGQHKKIYIPNKPTVDLSQEMNNKKPEEIGKIIARKYRELNLQNYAFVVTGQLCLGRGITFQSQDFIFSASIIPYMNNRASLYQCATRVAGNVKDFQESKHIIYCSRKTYKILKEMEDCAINVATILYKNGGTEVDKSLVSEITRITSSKFEKPLEFDSFIEAKEYIKERFNKNPKRFRQNEEGFYEATIKKITKIWSYEEIVEKNIASGSANNDYNFYPCYKEVADADSVVFVVIPRKVK
jgi:hypothetical protein